MEPNRAKRRTLLVALAIGVLAIAGCRTTSSTQSTVAIPTSSTKVARGTATPASTATPVSFLPIGSATANPAEPSNFGLILDQVDTDPGALSYVSISQFIVTGRVEKILPARWSTPDGICPGNPYDVVPQAATIVTPYVIALDGRPILNRSSLNLDSGRIIALINGGSVGDDSITIQLPWMNLAVGERVLITLDDNPTTYNPPGPVTTDAGPGWWLTMKWTLAEDGQAVSWRDTRDAADLVAEFSDAIKFLNPRTPPTATPAP